MPTRSGLPNFESFFVPTVDCLKARGESMTVSEMENDVAAAWNLSEACLSVLAIDGRRTQFQAELSRVRTCLKKAGVLDDSAQGVWRLTYRGAKMSKAAIRAVPRQIQKLERQERRERAARLARLARQARKGGQADEADQAGSDEDEDEVFDLEWRGHLLDTVRRMVPGAFERLAQRLLREAGFRYVNVLGRSGDGGIDGVGILRVGLLSFHVMFQCKRDRGAVGARVVRDFRDEMKGQVDKGLIITTATFDLEAKREATRTDVPALSLIDGHELCDLLKRYRIGVTVTEADAIELDQSALSEV